MYVGIVMSLLSAIAIMFIAISTSYGMNKIQRDLIQIHWFQNVIDECDNNIRTMHSYKSI